MYEDQLLALSRDPRFRSTEPLQDPVSERRNPACGDELALDFSEQGHCVHSLRFHAQGCAVCVASAAALCETLNGCAVDTARLRVQEAMAFFESDSEWTHSWGTPSLPALGAVRARPMRMACVRMAWQAMQEALKE